MGVHKEGQASDYWLTNIREGKALILVYTNSTNILTGPLHTCALWMSADRYYQLLRFFHVSDPYIHPDVPIEVEDKMTQEEIITMWWYKLEPLMSILRNNFERCWAPGSNVSIDEMMIRFFGRSLHTQKIPSKPIKQGYKMWALCEAGYLYTFMWNSRIKGIGELIKNPNLTLTASMVYQLANKLPLLQQGMTYSIYLDNYFTSIPLFSELRRQGFGACGTTRPANSGSAYPLILEAMKDKRYGLRLPWGTLLAVPTGDVLCLGWIDNNCVTALSTVHTVDRAYNNVTRLRKRPAETSTNAKTARRAFGDEARLELDIPRFINDYNYYIGGVDIANQHRQVYHTQRRANRNWMSLFYWAVDHATIKAFKIGVNKGAWTARGHRDFRKLLYQELFSFARQAKERRCTDILQPQRNNPHIDHAETHLFFRPKTYAWCSHLKKISSCLLRPATPMKRSFGTPISSNIRSKKPGRTEYGCKSCGIALCKGICWDQWHSSSIPAHDDPGASIPSEMA